MLPRRRRRLAVRRVRLRRRHGLGLAGVVMILGAGMLIGALAKSGGGSGTPAAETTATLPFAAASLPALTPSLALPVIQPDPGRLQQAQVVHVVDGDTIDVRVGGQTERVRYYGIDTPERGQPCFSEATERNKELVAQAVLLLPDARERDRYGRLLRYVFEEDSVSIDARLIAEGLAHAWRQDGVYKGEMIALEAQAHAAGVGCLWSTATP
jgi:micrococcal nuclease